VIDSFKTTLGSMTTIFINIWELLPDLQSIIIGALWIIYLYKKIEMENK
jgi:hypothetical protein